MASRQRVLTAFSHQEPDRVPAWLGASPEWKQLAREYLSLADDEALLRYSISKGPELENPLDPASAPTGNTVVVLDEVYATPAGIPRHWQDAVANWPDLARVMGERHVCVDTTAAGGNAALLGGAS